MPHRPQDSPYTVLLHQQGVVHGARSAKLVLLRAPNSWRRLISATVRTRELSTPSFADTNCIIEFVRTREQNDKRVPSFSPVLARIRVFQMVVVTDSSFRESWKNMEIADREHPSGGYVLLLVTTFY